ncbi:MAG: ABC transporter permease [Limisphaerales bacterium]
MTNDVKFALRLLIRNPGFTAVAVLTLALGIGATTIVFSIVNGVLLQPLGYPDSHQIVQVFEGNEKDGFTYNYQNQTSPRNFLDWREKNAVFESIASYANFKESVTRSFVFTGSDTPRRLSGRFVSTNYFKVFGMKPILGRTFTPGEERRGSARLVVISHSFWNQEFNQNPQVIGKTITLENAGKHTYSIIGVMPPGFSYPQRSSVWVSLAHAPAFRDWDRKNVLMAQRGGTVMRCVARIKDGVSLERATAEMNALQKAIYEEHKGQELQGQDFKIGENIALEPLLDSVVSRVRSSLILFSGAVALLLLISCANVANLLLSRALTRQREMSIRASQGASRWHLVRQLLTESAVLSLVAGIAGSALAWWGTKFVLQFSAGAIPRAGDVGMDWRVLAFTLVVSIITGTLFGLAPALQSSKTNLNDALREGANRLTGNRSQHYIRNGFTVTQIALALVLLIGAGLLIQSFNHLQSVKPGYAADELLTVEMNLAGAAYPNRKQRVNFINRAVDEMRATPGVEAAAATSLLAIREGWPHQFYRKEHGPPSDKREWKRLGTRAIGPGYHQTYGIPLLRGREIDTRDTWDSERVVMVNQAFANLEYPDEEVLDKLINISGVDYRVIGVFDDFKNRGLTKKASPEANVPLAQWPHADALSVFLTVRTENNPKGLQPIVTEKIRQLNPDQPLNSFVVMQTYVDAGRAIDRFRSLLITMFALAALVLASVGIYGVVSYSVAQRTNELGIRMALGAQRSDLLKLILKQGLQLTLLGVAIGLAGGLAVTRLLASQLYNISTTDPLTFVGVALILATIGMLACLVPAVRAMMVSPIKALRYE